MRFLVPAIGALAVALTTGEAQQRSALTGRWLVALAPPNRGETVFRMELEVSDGNEWTARSRPGAARAFISAPKYLLGRVLRQVPAGGALVYVEKGVIDTADARPRLKGRLESPMFGSFLMEATLTGDVLSGPLRRDSAGPKVGDFHAVRDTSDQSIRDYPTIAANIRRELTRHIFDPRLLQKGAFRDFLDAVDRGFAEASDDLDALAVFYSRVRRVGTSHIDLVRDPELAMTPLDQLANRVLAPPDSLVRLQFLVPGVAYIYVRKWDQVTPAIDRAFARIDSVKPHTLILDMRGNSGGDNSAGSPLAHLFRDSADVGVFVTNKWFGAHDAPPTPGERRTFPVVTRDEGMELINVMRERGTVAARIRPRAPFFGGRVYVLTDNGSASASEPVAHHLRVTERATLVGTKTAGAMLSALPHPVGEGWVLLVPEADYYAADGTRLEGEGVEPHVKASSAEAFSAAARAIAKYEPADGTMLVGIAAVSARRWNAAFDAFERALTLRPNDPAALYQIGRVAALSKTRLDRGEQALRAYLNIPWRAGLSSPASAHLRLGQIYEARSAFDEARQEYAIALQLEPRNEDVLRALSALNSLQQRPK